MIAGKTEGKNITQEKHLDEVPSRNTVKEGGVSQLYCAKTALRRAIDVHSIMNTITYSSCFHVLYKSMKTQYCVMK